MQRVRFNGREEPHVIVRRLFKKNGVGLCYFHFAIGPMTGPGFSAPNSRPGASRCPTRGSVGVGLHATRFSRD